MKKLSSLLLLLILVAQAPAQTTSIKKGQSLFNGKDLSGWRQLNGKANYTVQNGVIVGTTVLNEPNSFLVTEKDYGDFVLELEFKADSTMNSGIQFRSLSNPQYQNGRVHGYQFEIDPSARGWTGGVYDEARRDWLYPLDFNAAAKSAFKQNSWNKVRIECIGPHLRTFINDVPSAYVIDDLTPKGFIALQVHSISKPEDEGRQIRWRNIRIQTENLTASPPDKIFVVNLLSNHLSEQEKKNGVQLLWDGSTTAGWRGAYKESFPTSGWEIKDGSLVVLPASGAEATNGGDIVTASEYSAFILQFDFKITEGANSGVKYFVTETEGNSGSAIGLEYQILDDEKHPDAKLGAAGNRKLASLYDLIPALPQQRARRKTGEWNRGMVVVYPNNKVEHWLNGWKLVEYQRGGPVYDALVARSKYEKWKGFGLAPKGRILLQDHGNQVWFRSLKIQELKPGDLPLCSCR